MFEIAYKEYDLVIKFTYNVINGIIRLILLVLDGFIFTYEIGGKLMPIFKSKCKDRYINQNSIMKSLRVDKTTAITIDELKDVCTAETGKNISQNSILEGIVNQFIADVENIAKTDETQAINKVIAVLEL